MKCAYCGKEAKGTREHIISCAILDLFPECCATVDPVRKIMYEADPTIKDVCSECNNNKISYIDKYAKDFIGRYFVQKYNEYDNVQIEFNYTMIQKILLKYAFNDMRSQKADCSFFDKEILHYLLNEDDTIPKENISVLCGIAVNVSPLPDAVFGNVKLRWVKDPAFLSNSMVDFIDGTHQIYFNDAVSRQEFYDLRVSYVFRFNSAQFLLMCWDRKSKKIEENKAILACRYPYHLLCADETSAVLPVCTNAYNYHSIELINVKWDRLFEIGILQRWANGESYLYKEFYEKEWKKEEEAIRQAHPRQ